MSLHRVYVNRKIEGDPPVGGEHLRFIDLEASDAAGARSKAELELDAHEDVGDIVELRPEFM